MTNWKENVGVLRLYGCSGVFENDPCSDGLDGFQLNTIGRDYIYYGAHSSHSQGGIVVSLGLGVLCFYFCAIMLLSIMLSEFTILERDYATYMLA